VGGKADKGGSIRFIDVISFNYYGYLAHSCASVNANGLREGGRRRVEGAAALGQLIKRRYTAHPTPLPSLTSVVLGQRSEGNEMQTKHVCVY